MTLTELQLREKGLLNSHQYRFIEYGKACKDILQMSRSFAGLHLSENMLISDIARLYIEQEKKDYQLTEKEEHLLHIKLAHEYIVNDVMSFNELYEILKIENKKLSFEAAQTLLMNKSYYDKIPPETLKEVLNMIRLEYETVSE